ncbi:TPA: helix-turn-helix domain-containing protein [Legionella pneumophila]|nr:helix-turn-helix domain-containing protein [Legionella pneumophila]
MDKKVFKEIEAANYICMSKSFLSQDRVNGALKNRTPGPKFIKIGRSIRYLKEDLDVWLEQQRKP